MKVGVINVTGYSGSELVRLLYRHPDVKISSVTGRSAAGQKLADTFPHLSDLDLMIQPELDASLDLVFSALPHKASAEAVIPLLEDGIKVVDISADFRLRQPSQYEEWYGVAHPAPEYLEEAVYGLTELNRSQVVTARLVANPGCFPTSAILALAPVVKEGLIGGRHCRGQQIRCLWWRAYLKPDHSLFGSQRERNGLLGKRSPPPAGDYSGARQTYITPIGLEPFRRGSNVYRMSLKSIEMTVSLPR